MSTRQAVEKELFSACEAGDVDRVRRAIAAGVDPKKAINIKDALIAGETPLHVACRYHGTNLYVHFILIMTYNLLESF
jgi:hypothetical protein